MYYLLCMKNGKIALLFVIQIALHFIFIYKRQILQKLRLE